MDILKQLAEELHLEPRRVESVVALLDDGNTIPFIARYRKEQTGAMDDQVLRSLSERLDYLRRLQEQKEKIRASLEEQEVLNEELSESLDRAVTLAELEDLYRPYRPKRRTRASQAKERGLQPLGGCPVCPAGLRSGAGGPGRGVPESGKGGGVGGSRPSGSPGYFGGADCGRPRRPGKAAGLFGRLR